MYQLEGNDAKTGKYAAFDVGWTLWREKKHNEAIATLNEYCSKNSGDAVAQGLAMRGLRKLRGIKKNGLFCTDSLFFFFFISFMAVFFFFFFDGWKTVLKVGTSIRDIFRRYVIKKNACVPPISSTFTISPEFNEQGTCVSGPRAG